MLSPTAVPRWLCGILALLPSVQAADLAPPADYEGKPLAHVRFDPAVQPFTSADLDRLVSFPAGAPIHLAGIREAIKRLYATGEYSNIEVDSEPATGGVTLVFHTTPQWFVGPVEVHGKLNAPPNSGQLVNATQFDLGAPFDESRLPGAVDALRDLLQRNGLYKATVTSQVVRDAPHQQVSITFQVESNKRARLELPAIIGDPKLPAANVARAARYKEIFFFPWEPATQENVQDGLQSIRKLYQKKDLLTATATLDHVDYLPAENRVHPTIKVEGGPKIKILAEGAKISKGKLKEYVPVFEEGTVNRDLLVAGSRNLRDYFQDKGYFNVQVDFSNRDTSQNLTQITYTVDLGQEHRVVKLEIKGNRYFSVHTIRERMFLQTKGFLVLRHGRYTESFAKTDEEAIQRLYRDNGFRDCKVSVVTADDYQGKKGDLAITVTIEEGPQYMVSGLTVSGITRADKDALIAGLSSVAGQPYSEATVGQDRDYLLERYQSAGYPNAAFDSQTMPGPDPHQIELHYTITEGLPQYVREVLISGLHTTRLHLVVPFIKLHPGDPLSWTEMSDMQRHLYDLGVFDKVDMAIQDPDGDAPQKNVDFHLVEGSRYTVSVGVGAELAKIGGSATDISDPNGTNGIAPNFDLSVSRLNMWGLGHTIVLEGLYSPLDSRASLSYSIPRFLNGEGRTIKLSALYDDTHDVLTFAAKRVQGGVLVSQKVNKATSLLFRYSWTDNQVDSASLKINPLLIPLYSQPSHVGLVGVNLVVDRRDNPTDAHHGIYNSVDVGFASHQLGGTTNFARFLGRNSYYKQIFGDFVLASNTEFGVIQPFHTGGISPDEYIPLPERFFGGGEYTMRGFPMDQAGPRDTDTGFPIGGNALLFHSTELRFPFIGSNIFGVVFHDIGNVYSSLDDVSLRFHQRNLTDFNYAVQAVGYGIRYKTPLGPLAIDLAYSINPPSYNGLEGTYEQLLFGGATRTLQSVSHFQFFFSIGQAF